MALQVSTALYLDDVRTPIIPGFHVVRSYDEFVAHIKAHGVPDLISFDHDLADDHYPRGVQTGNEQIDYSDCKEKTGFHCAAFLVEFSQPVRYWNVHSWNVVGKRNIQELLRKHYPAGEQNLEIPFVCR